MRVVDLLGGPCKQKVKVSAWSSHRVIEEVGDLVNNYHALGYDCIKFKCDLQDDVQGWCETIAATVPSMQVILDPNQRWQ